MPRSTASYSSATAELSNLAVASCNVHHAGDFLHACKCLNRLSYSSAGAGPIFAMQPRMSKLLPAAFLLSLALMVLTILGAA